MRGLDPQSPEKIIPKNLLRRRLEKGMTQQEVADRIHIDRSTYSKYESGKVDPSLDKCIFLCIVLDMDPNELMGWGDEPKEEK